MVTIRLYRTWSLFNGVGMSLARRYCSWIDWTFWIYCHRLQQLPATIRTTKTNPIHFHCLDESRHSPANAIGKSKRGSLILAKRNHIFLSSVQNQVKKGIKKRKLMPNKNLFLPKHFSLLRMFLWKHVKNKNKIKLRESKNREVKRDTSISTIEKKMSCCFESLSMLIPIFL